MQVDGKTVLITGGASGLGRASAAHFLGLGVKVGILDLETAIEAAVDHENALSIAADVSDQASVERAVELIQSKLGTPRVVMNCAGIAPAARIVGRDGKLSIDDFERTMRVNVLGSYNVMSIAAAQMMKLDIQPDEERGVIINTASIAFEDGQLGQAAYAASKGAIASMSLPAAREFAQSAIRVVAIAPGLFSTPMMEGLPTEVADKITANIPFPNRLGAPNEYAQLAEHIVRNPYINGTTIRLDAGVRLPPR